MIMARRWSALAGIIVMAATAGCSSGSVTKPPRPARVSSSSTSVNTDAAIAIKGAVSDELLRRGLASMVDLGEPGVSWVVSKNIVVISGSGSADATEVANLAKMADRDLSSPVLKPDSRRILILLPKNSAQLRRWEPDADLAARAAAFTKASGQLPSTIFIRPDAWAHELDQRQVIITHEVVHARGRVADRQPLWLVEGYATWLSTALVSPGMGLTYPIGARLPADADFNSPTTEYGAYMLSAAFFQYLATRFGSAKVSAFYSASKSAATPAAFQATFGVDQNSAVAAWKAGFKRSVTFSY